MDQVDWVVFYSQQHLMSKYLLFSNKMVFIVLLFIVVKSMLCKPYDKIHVNYTNSKYSF